MKINPEILKYLDEVRVPHKEGVPYLVSLFLGYQPSYIPVNVIKSVYQTGIFTFKDNKITWNVDLILTDNVSSGYDWVKTEYEPLFKEKNPKKGGKVREATTRMRKVFVENPDLRKSDVLGATRLYLMNTNPSYIRFPHFFIYKGMGADKTYDLLDWVEKYKNSINRGKGRMSTSNTMK